VRRDINIVKLTIKTIYALSKTSPPAYETPTVQASVDKARIAAEYCSGIGKVKSAPTKKLTHYGFIGRSTEIILISNAVGYVKKPKKPRAEKRIIKTTKRPGPNKKARATTIAPNPITPVRRS